MQAIFVHHHTVAHHERSGWQHQPFGFPATWSVPEYTTVDSFYVELIQEGTLSQAVFTIHETVKDNARVVLPDGSINKPATPPELLIRGSLPAFDGFKKSNKVGDNPLLIKQALLAFIETHKVGCLLKTGGLPEVVFWGTKRPHRKVFNQIIDYQYKGGCLLEDGQAAKAAFCIQRGLPACLLEESGLEVAFQMALGLSGKTEAQVLAEAGIPSLFSLKK